MKDNFFITTPIYYSNWIPHIGHSYSSIIADCIARYNKMTWKWVKLSTWVDENSQKSVLKAEEEGVDIMMYLDKIAWKHKEVWDWLKIWYTDFIRTTEQKHHDFVRTVLQKSFDKWDIYEWVYEWMYCLWCEAFKKDDDLIFLPGGDRIKVCPDHLKEPDKIKEKNYFFRLSKYEDDLKKLYKNNPEFVIPSGRFNEVKAFVERGLEDFSISRETNKFWIKLPFDEEQVTYVWYDALFNYLTVCQNGDENYWPANLHVVWKDIIRFHAIYWPAMLLSAWFEIPKQILTTWYFTIDWQKISKSLWNVIDPVDFCETYSKDLLLLYILSSFHIWNDWDFDQKNAILMYNSKLANNLGNLLNRGVVLTLKLWDIELMWNIDQDIDNKIKEYIEKFWDYMGVYNLKEAIDLSFWILDVLNKYVDENQPWKLIKEESKKSELVIILYTVLESLRIVWLMLYTFFPEKMLEMFIKMWLIDYKSKLENWYLKELLDEKVIFKIKEKWKVLFQRIELDNII